MPPRQRKRGGADEDVFTLEAEVSGEGKKSEEKINLWDGPSLKRALDEAVIEVRLLWHGSRPLTLCVYRQGQSCDAGHLHCSGRDA